MYNNNTNNNNINHHLHRYQFDRHPTPPALYYNQPYSTLNTPPLPPQSNIRPDSRQSSLVHLLQTKEDQWPRQWSWTGVDIPIQNLRALSQSITQDTTNQESLGSSAEVLNYSFGTNRWKVEVVKTHSRRPSAPSTPTNTNNTHQPLSHYEQRHQLLHQQPRKTINPDDERLSLFLTCHELEVDWPVSRSISTSILISIKEPRIPLHLNPITDLGSPAEGWIWRTYCEEHSFEREREVWESHDFPSLSSLLENPRVALFDSCILTIQIGTPATLSIPQIPNASYVPHSILESLESLLDDPNTSDLQILVTEMEERPNEEEDEPGRRRATCRFRKRLLYAHSSILKRRSEYFQTMLTDEANGGGWAESGSVSTTSLNTKPSPLERKLGLIRIADFDFVTVYWLVRWLYSNRIFFSDHEDVRGQCQRGAVLTSFEEGGRSPSVDPWVWQAHGGERGEMRAGEEGAASHDPVSIQEPPRQTAPSTSSASRRLHPSATVNGFPPFSAIPKPSEPILSSPTTLHSGLHHLSKKSNDWIAGDPHSHPVQIPSKASAFSIYRLAHRYELNDLQHIAITHLCSHLTPASAFPILLASFVFPDLHAQVKAYCLAHYFEILTQPEFSKCYSEVGEGLWEHGGEVLLSFTMSLMPGPPAATI